MMKIVIKIILEEVIKEIIEEILWKVVKEKIKWNKKLENIEESLKNDKAAKWNITFFKDSFFVK